MHAAIGQFSTALAQGSQFAVPVAGPRLASVPDAPFVPNRYRERRLNWPAIIAVAIGHVLLLILLVTLDVVPVGQLRHAPLVVDMIDLPTVPPREPLPPEAEIKPVKIEPPLIVAPEPEVRIEQPRSPVMAAPAPQPLALVVPPAASAVPSGPISAPDLATSMIAARPPKYPLESRRKREQGIVVLNVLVDAKGSVAQVSVAKSSGFVRLDKAALEAVRRWRWSPAVRNGQPVLVKGYVDIPFILEG